MFLLIDKTPHMARCVQSISIHLMFLLIPAQRREVRAVKDFNTSHVSINQLLTLNFFWFINFNTSHVSINQTETRKTAFWGRISIHLMFLLIWTQGLLGRSMNQISIHLMFLLIASGNTNAPRKTNFNTSHVSINQICCGGCRGQNIFQYISCFY